MRNFLQFTQIGVAFVLFAFIGLHSANAQTTTFTLDGVALPTPVAGVENDGVQVNAIVTNIGGLAGDNYYYYISNPVDGGAGTWETGEDFGDFGVSWSNVTTTGTELTRVEADDLIRFNATGMVGTEVSLTFYALQDDDMSAATAGDGDGNFADFAAAQAAFDISDAQTLRVTVQSPPPTTFELGSLPNPVADTENGGGQVSTLVTNVMGGSDGDSYYYVSDPVNGGAGTWEENDGTGWSAITGTGLIAVEADDLIRFNASSGAVAGTVATLDFHVVNAFSEPADPEALTFISMAQTLSVTVQSSSSIRRVTTTGDAGNDGSTWANAMTLQAALAASTTAGDQIWIEAGTYKPDGTDREATFTIRGGVLVYGGFAGAEVTLADRSGGATTLSGDLLGDDMSRPGEGEDGTAYIASRDDNSYSVVRVAGAGVTLDGLTITAGERGAEIAVNASPLSGNIRSGAGLYAMQGATDTVVSNCNFTNNSIAVPGVGFIELAYGGGAFFQEDAELTNCTFTDNNAVSTGLEAGFALMFGGGLAFFQGATLTDCTFTDNEALAGGGAYFSTGATLTNCSFTSNSADGSSGGALFGAVNALLSAEATPIGAEATLTACTFTDNEANSSGGAFFVDGVATLTNCVVVGNSATDGNGGGLSFGAGGTVINSTFYKNTATERGGGVYVTYDGDGDNPFNLRNSILVDNTATTAGNAIYFVDSGAPRRATDIEAVMDHNLIGGGEADLGIALFDRTVNTYTTVALATATNVALTNTVEESDATMVFASTDAANANFLRLVDGSPAVGAGDNDYVNNAVPPIATDAAGNTRIQSGTVDLGAYEGGIAALVAPTAQTLTFTDPTGGATVRVGESIDLEATTNAPDGAMLAITFTSSATGIAVVENDGDGTFSLRLDGTGDVTITATQAGGTGANGVTYARATATQTITVMAAVPVALNIRRVTTTGTGDGSTWTQAMTLQAALMASTTAGDQVWIAAGTYKPDATDRTATFTIPEGVLVYGGFDPIADASDADASSRSGGATILSGDLADNDASRTRTDNSRTVVTIGGADVTLDGLTIEAGEGEISSNGGGLFAGAGTTGITLTACTFNNNSADDQGGGAYFMESATLTDCTFNNNSVNDDGGGAFFRAAPTLTNCVFTDNNAIDDGGGAYFLQAATLTGCDFKDNNSDYWGGGAFFSGTATVTNCTFTANTANGGPSEGGGAYFNRTGIVTQCTFTDNETTNNGGGVYFDEVGTVINSTLYNNSADDEGGGLYVSGFVFPFTLQNSILVGNTAADAASGHQTYVNNTAADEVNVQNNLFAGATGIVYDDDASVNITEVNTIEESDATVVFASTTATNENYLRLATGSPAVNAGNNLYLNNGTPGNTDDDITIDLAGEMRIQGGTVDLGAYESAFVPALPTAQTLTFDDPTRGATVRVGQSIDLVATTDAPDGAMLAITFTSSATNIAVVENDGDGTFSLRFDAAGDVTITATQAGGVGADGVTYARATATQTITVMAALPAGTTIRRVTTIGTGDGSSWTQAMTLQAALMASTMAGDQVWIAAGRYKPHADDRTATFTIPEGVLVYGGFDPVADATDTDASSRSGAATILSGDLLSDDIARPDATEDQTTYNASRDDNSYTVVTISGADVVLDGLTISGGERGTEEASFSSTEYHGAGLYGGFGAGGLTLQDVILRSNNAENEGGGAYFKSAVSMTNATFTNNTATEDGGGAYFNWITTITGSTFSNNRTSDGSGGGAYFGSVNITDPSISSVATVTNSTFTNNSVSDDKGGGAYFDGSATVTSCTFRGNTATGNFTRGGGAHFDDEATVVNCVFANNRVDGNGGGAYFSLFSLGDINSTVTNSTFYNNSSNQGGGIYANYGVTPNSNTTNFNLRNSILINNMANFGADELYISTQHATQIANIDNNLIQGGNNEPRVLVVTDDGVSISNIVDASDAAVVFASTDATEDDYLRLATGSPAVNAGNDTYIPAGITIDAAGEMRIQGGTVDLGAYESGIATPVALNIRRVTTTGTGDGSSWTQAMSLQAALAASNEAGNQIWIAEGTYKPHADDRTVTFTISEGVLVYGGFDPVADATDTDASSRSGAATILSGDLLGDDIARPEATEDQTVYDASRNDNSHTVVTIAGVDVTLDGLTIQSGSRGTRTNLRLPLFGGGGLYSNFANTSLNACVFTNNSATHHGGGAYFLESPTLTGCTFTGNEVEFSGGGAYFEGVATLTGCTFTGNEVENRGGGAFFDGTATVTNCTFTENTANGGFSEGGGAFFDADAILIDCTFTNNSADRDDDVGEGGGAYFEGQATLTGCTFTDNEADDEGGGAYFEGQGTLTNCTFTGNEAADLGGGIYFLAEATLTNCTFTGNEASRSYGGAYFDEAATLTGCTFTGNKAIGDDGSVGHGGGANFGGTATLTGCTFTGNTAESDGGGANFRGVAMLTNCTFADNEASHGGGVFFFAQATLTNCTFTGNSARFSGGGVDFFSGGTVINSTFYNNTADEGGGIWVIFNDGDRDMDGVQVSPFILQNSILVGNTAMDAAAGNQVEVNNTGSADVVNIQSNLIAGGATGTGAGIRYANATSTNITEAGTVDESNASVVFASTDASATATFLRLATGSPAINAGNNSYIPAGITTDAAGNARIQDGTVDLGAYEGAAVPSSMAQTITFTSPTAGTVGTPITLVATATSMGAVTFAITEVQDADGNVVVGAAADAVATLSSSTLTLSAAGTVTVTASQAGGDIGGTIYATATQTQVITITVEAVLGIEEDTDDFVLYPNPTSGKLHFSERVGQFRLYSVEGRLLETQKNVRSADLTALPSGLYFVEVVRDGWSVRWRIVRE